MKGIILAGGLGTRMYPLTQIISKQLLPVYDKPMIYYPLYTLMSADIRDILIISTPYDLPQYEKLLGDGNNWGISISYIKQLLPNGLPEAFILGEEFIGSDACVLILGDNIFYGSQLTSILNKASRKLSEGFSTIFGYYVDNPECFGVIEFDEEQKALLIEEKPEKPKSNYIVPGLYFYDNHVIEYSKLLRMSNRNELEISDINNLYLSRGNLNVEILDQDITWFDAGTTESLLNISNFICSIERTCGIVVSAPEEIAYRKNWINEENLINSMQRYNKSSYIKNLKKMFQAEFFHQI